MFRFPRFLRNQFALLAVLLGLVLFFGFTTRYFFSVTTLRTIANEIPADLLVAVGMTFVLISAGVDLSVGSILAVSGATLGVLLVDHGWALPWAVLGCVATGLLCGAVNGWLTTQFSLPSFIVTLGTLEVARGAAYSITRSQTKYIGLPIERVTATSFLGLDLTFWFALVVVALAQFVLSRTVFGRYLVALGTNEEALRLSGVRPGPIRFTVFALSGVLSALAAVIHCSRLASADPNAGGGFELQAIAAVVIGGTSLMGGRGSVVSSFSGVLIIAVLANGLSQLGAAEPVKRIVTGAVIVVAVVVDHFRVRGQARRDAAGGR